MIASSRLVLTALASGLLAVPIHGCGGGYETLESPTDAAPPDATIVADASAPPFDAGAPADAQPGVDAALDRDAEPDACVPACAGKCAGADGCGGLCATPCALPMTCGGGGTPGTCGTCLPNDSQERSPSIAASVDGPGTRAWATPEGTFAAGEATVSGMTDGQTSERLQTSGFGFQIPANAVVKGIELKITRSSLSGIGIVDDAVRLLEGGALAGSSKAKGGVWAPVPSTITYGGANDLWNTAITPAEVNAPGFGASIAVKYTMSAGNDWAMVDGISIRVHYSVECN